MRQVLLVEDDPQIVALLSIHFGDIDCQLTKCLDGAEGLEKALNNTYDLIILDLMLPKMDGMEVCRRIRARNITTPILMLTARSEEIDKVLGLEMGADDYLTKPFSIRELLARVKAIFRRTQILQEQMASVGQEQVLRYGDMVLDLDKRKLTIKEQRIELSPKEFDLLSLLASNPGKSYNRNRILNLVWGYDFEGYEHTVNSHINRLRAKIEPDMNQPTYILTTWGVGYRFNEDIHSPTNLGA